MRGFFIDRYGSDTNDTLPSVAREKGGLIFGSAENGGIGVLTCSPLELTLFRLTVSDEEKGA